MENKKAYLIKDITEYGKFVSYCIKNDVFVWRSYWDDRESGDRYYQIDWKEGRCYYSSRYYYEANGYKLVIPIFRLDKYGNYVIDHEKEIIDE